MLDKGQDRVAGSLDHLGYWCQCFVRCGLLHTSQICDSSGERSGEVHKQQKCFFKKIIYSTEFQISRSNYSC